jgi:hypothetical protein
MNFAIPARGLGLGQVSNKTVFTTYPPAFVWSFNGDAQGIIYFLGNATGSFANPHPAIITVSRSTDIVGTAADITNRTGEYSTTDQNANEFIKIDFGATRHVIVSDYSIRDGSNSLAAQAIRNWKLQGSNDNSGWTDLDVRASDTTIATGSQYPWGHFTLSAPSGVAYRYLRLLDTGNGAGGLLYLQVCELEFYGTLI